MPKANLLSSIVKYRGLLSGLGFTDIAINDETGHCRDGFRPNLVACPNQEREAGRMSFGTRLATRPVAKGMAAWFGLTTHRYLLTSARRPERGSEHAQKSPCKMPFVWTGSYMRMPGDERA